MDRSRLIELREALSRAEGAYQKWGACNTAGKAAAEQVDIDIGYQEAQSAYLKAFQAYHSALKQFGGM